MEFGEERLITPHAMLEDNSEGNKVRPKTLTDYIGQQKVKDNLTVYVEAAKARGEALDHVLLYGPPGLGKTTLAGIIANELNVQIKITSGPAIERAGDLAAILTNLEPHDVLAKGQAPGRCVSICLRLRSLVQPPAPVCSQARSVTVLVSLSVWSFTPMKSSSRLSHAVQKY